MAAFRETAGVEADPIPMVKTGVFGRFGGSGSTPTANGEAKMRIAVAPGRVETDSGRR